ncbi:hypothetical protein C8R45DRAFT_923239 [Mycena sanguinolenta]|nr:hypothetical protein C8R45DRAFT_923239 [Mycena sanguinolenta]
MYYIENRPGSSGGHDQAQARLSDAIRKTGLCSTGIVLSGLRIGNVKISLLGIEKGLDHLWNDRGVSTVFKDARQTLKVLNIQHSVLFLAFKTGLKTVDKIF